MAFEHLPSEVIDLIFRFTVSCSQHPWATSRRPCLHWHQVSRLKHLAALRRVNKAFCERLTPAAFEHVSCEKKNRRHLTMQQLPGTHFAALVRTLHLTVSPKDFHPRMLSAFNAQVRPEVKPSKRLAHYFETVRHWLTPALRSFFNVRALCLTTTYEGAHVHLVLRNQLLLPCFGMLCDVVKSAELMKLEELQLGLPYQGGYEDFFDDLNYRKRLKAISKGIRSASIKLYDYHDDNFTIMPVF